MNNKDELLREMCKNANIPKKIYENPRFFFTIKQVNNFYYRGFINWNNISTCNIWYICLARMG